VGTEESESATSDQKGEKNMQNIEIGHHVPDIRLPLLSGIGDAGFEDYKGNRLIVFAWASW
jgi:hypothetical protein